MIFNSFQFLWLFPLIFIIYWVCHRLNKPHFKLSKYFLLTVSYGVCMQWDTLFGAMLLFVTLATYSGALVIDRFGGKRHRKLLVWVFSSFSLLPLLTFKYFNFITQAGASALQWIGIDAATPQLSWVVPLGLSFYTFQALGYMLDVYRRKISVETNVVNYMLFVAFFPQILCGPISKASTLLPQLRDPHSFSYAEGVSGLRLILWGMFMKVVIADRLGLYVYSVYSNFSYLSGTSSIIAAVFYTLQLYCDFAGYSYMAAGVARLLGVDLVINFRRPLFAQSVGDFWRRWNVSLTRWLTDYVYIPLGGNRRGKARTYVNIIATFLVSGLWHGANWTFIFWGLLHGVALVMEKAIGINKHKSHGLVRVVRTIVVFLFVTLAFVYFRMPSFSEANAVILHMSQFGKPFVDTMVLGYCAIGLAVLFTVEFIMENRQGLYLRFATGGSVPVRILRWMVYLNILALIVLIGVLDSSQFIYLLF